MTKDAFLQVLRKCKNNFKWRLDNIGLIRGSLYGSFYCPIEAVCQSKTGKFYRWSSAANLLQLGECATDIVRAADNSVFQDEDLRQELLDILLEGVDHD